MENQEQTQEKSEEKQKELELQKLKIKKIKPVNLQFKQKYAFTRAGKTKIG